MDQIEQRSSLLHKPRRHSRVRITAPFVCSLISLKSRHWLRRPSIELGVVYDLSLMGARVSTEAAIKPGDEVALNLRLPRQIQPAEIAVARVQWTKDQFLGLSFMELSPAAQSRLRKYVGILSSPST